MPDNIYGNADAKRNGEAIENLCENMYKDKCVPLIKPENIAGKNERARIFRCTSELLLNNLSLRASSQVWG